MLVKACVFSPFMNGVQIKCFEEPIEFGFLIVQSMHTLTRNS